MSELREIFDRHDQFMIDKWAHYLDIYEAHFARFRNRHVRILEIGIFHGGSLQLWREYFGPEAEILGIDINPECKKLEGERIRIEIGSQADPLLLEKIKTEYPPFDIIIDDGSHDPEHQIATFESLFSHVAENGVYLIEDLHTSYWSSYGYHLRKWNNFIEYGKHLIDKINAYFIPYHQIKVDYFTRNISGLHFYDSILVIEKRFRKDRPHRIFSGKPTIQDKNSGKDAMAELIANQIEHEEQTSLLPELPRQPKIIKKAMLYPIDLGVSLMNKQLTKSSPDGALLNALKILQNDGIVVLLNKAGKKIRKPKK